MEPIEDTSPGADESTVRIIKRYANRKLYDTRDSRYVTLQEIAEFVRGTEDVRIIDNRTKDDLTSVTLAQIIYEEEKKGDETRSVRSLRDFIQQGKSRMREGRERLFESFQRGPVGKLVGRRDEEQGEDAESAEAAEAPAEAPAEATPQAHEREGWAHLPRIADEGVRSLLQTALTRVRDLQAEVGRMGGRIEELEARLARRGGSEAPEPSSDEPPA